MSWNHIQPGGPGPAIRDYQWLKNEVDDRGRMLEIAGSQIAAMTLICEALTAQRDALADACKLAISRCAFCEDGTRTWATMHGIETRPCDRCGMLYTALALTPAAAASVLKERDRLREAAAAIVKKYDWLYQDMDTEYAAFFTAMGDQVKAIRAALAQPKVEEACESGAKPAS